MKRTTNYKKKLKIPGNGYIYAVVYRDLDSVISGFTAYSKTSVIKASFGISLFNKAEVGRLKIPGYAFVLKVTSKRFKSLYKLKRLEASILFSGTKNYDKFTIEPYSDPLYKLAVESLRSKS